EKEPGKWRVRGFSGRSGDGVGMETSRADRCSRYRARATLSRLYARVAQSGRPILHGPSREHALTPFWSPGLGQERSRGPEERGRGILLSRRAAGSARAGKGESVPRPGGTTEPGRDQPRTEYQPRVGKAVAGHSFQPSEHCALRTGGPLPARRGGQERTPL